MTLVPKHSVAEAVEIVGCAGASSTVKVVPAEELLHPEASVPLTVTTSPSARAAVAKVAAAEGPCAESPLTKNW